MINKIGSPSPTNTTQALIAATVLQVGYADDNVPYAEVVFTPHADPNNPENQNPEKMHAFVRMADQAQVADFFEQVRGYAPHEAELEATLIAAKKAGSLDIHGQLTTKIDEAKEFGHFAGVSNKEILEDRLGGIVLMMRGVNVTHKLKDGTAPIGNGSDDGVYLVTAQSMNFSLPIDRDNLEKLGSEAADYDIDLQDSMVRFVLTPATDGKPARASAYSVTKADNLNFNQIPNNPTSLNNMNDTNSRPYHVMSDSIIREGFMDMNVSAGGHHHRFTFDSNTFSGGDYDNVRGEELRGVANNWQSEHSHNISRFRAMEDFDTARNPQDTQTLAKNDFMRIVLLAAEEPRAFKDFLAKVRYNDPTAFVGVTKTDFTDPNISPDQKMVLELVKGVAHDPEKSFINISTHDKLKLAPKIESDLSEYMAASYISATDGVDSRAAYGKSRAAQSQLAHSSLDVVRFTDYGGNTADDQKKSGVYTIMIPATITTEVIAVGQEVDVTQAIFAHSSYVQNPQGTVTSGGVYKYLDTTQTLRDDLFAHKNVINRTFKPVDLPHSQSLGILNGEKPTDLSPNANSVFKQSFEAVNGMTVGTVDLNAGRDRARSNNVDIQSTAQAGFVVSKLRHKNNFQAFVVANENQDPTKALKRYDEMAKAMGHALGGFSKDNTSASHIKLIINAAVNGKRDELTDAQKLVSDMLLTDKLVEIEVPDPETGDKVKRGFNFSDVTNFVTEPQKGLRNAITADIAEKQVALRPEEESKYKAARKLETMTVEAKNLVVEKKEDVTQRYAASLRNQQPSNTPSMRA